MKFRLEPATAFALALGAGMVNAQDRHMMNGSDWDGRWMGGYGGMWVPVLVVVVVGLLAWIVMQKRK